MTFGVFQGGIPSSCAAPLLLELATLGHKADVGQEWILEMLEAVIKKGAHPSATLQLVATGQLWEETLEKVAQGFAHFLVTWTEIKTNQWKNLKFSPIVANPHKSRGYCIFSLTAYGNG
jgi:hypothetical protein